ncbi:MAG: ribonuclease Z [Anaerolineae bacterium]|jgi:ribonuclease Z|nr:ribonuclease Z [Anaerolineae bacterium]
MFEIVFFGTSASAPSIHRGLPSLMVLAGEHRFLIDCGEGTQRQILKSGIGFKKLHHILLTHGHLDHILGLGGLISTFAHWESIDELNIYGGRPALERVDALIYQVVLRGESANLKIKLFELQPGTLFIGKQFQVSAIPVTHRGTGNYGFVFQQQAHAPFLVDKATALGVPAGPERGLLVRGETITLSDGRVITPDQVLGEYEAGVKLVVIGDTGRTENLREHVQDADVLVIEATFLHHESEEARAFGHITARQAGELAAECGVKTLLLNHVSRRYRERDILEEARAAFPNTIIARDFDHFETRRGQVTGKKVEITTDEGELEG